MAQSYKAGFGKCKNYQEKEDVKDTERLLLYGWQSKIGSIKDRIGILLNKETLSDIKFLIGKKPKVKTYFAHKFLLSIGSPVFDAMFNGSFTSSCNNDGEVELSDEEPDAFYNLLLFLYTEKPKINVNNVLDTLYTAKKYLVTSLEELCVNFLQDCMDPEGAFYLLTKAEMFDEKELVEKCLNYIDTKPEAFETSGFLSTSENIVCKVLKRDSLRVPELFLYKCVINWAKEECKRRNVPENLENLKEILRKRIIPLIRFPLMRIEEFASEVASKNLKILNEQEIINMFVYFNVNPKPFVKFSVIPRYEPVDIGQTICRFTDTNKRWGYSGTSDKIRFTVNRKIYISAFGLYGSIHSPSKYDCKIQLLKSDTSCVIAENTTKFTCDGSNKIFKALFESDVEIEPNKQYTASATINGHDSYYGVGGKKKVSVQLPLNEIVEFEFSYEPACNNGTSVEDGQIPAIFFSLYMKP